MITNSQSMGWVESPLQLLALAEAHATGILNEPTTAVPRRGVPGLAATSRAIAELGLPSGLHISEPGVALPAQSKLLAIGDGFSGVVQRSLVAGNHDGVIIVDDGLATVELVRLLVDGKSLTRARVRRRSPNGVARWYLGRRAAKVLRAAADEGRLAIFTAVSIPDDIAARASALGIKIYQHDFQWLRSRRREAAPDERTIVLGSALATDGLIAREQYLEWVLGQADREPIAFYPHRRESDDVVKELARNPGVRVEQTELPVELSLRCLRDEQRVVSLPSTAVVSLRLLHMGSGAGIDLAAVPEAWWTRNASNRFRRNLARTIAA